MQQHSPGAGPVAGLEEGHQDVYTVVAGPHRMPCGCQSQSLPLKVTYSSAEMITMAAVETMNPDWWAKPG